LTDRRNGVINLLRVREKHIYGIRPRKDHRGVDLISDALPFGRLWYGEPDAVNNAIGCVKFCVEQGSDLPQKD
jgi:hypothetical protein